MSGGLNLFTLKATLGLDSSEYEQKIKDIIAQAKKDGEELGNALNGNGSSGGTRTAASPSTPTPISYDSKTLVRDIVSSDAIKWGAGLVKDAAKAGTDLVINSIGAASNLQEIQNVVDVTFAESAKAVDRWAENQAWKYGLSEMQAKQYASEYGAFFKGDYSNTEAAQMSMRLAEVVGDLASFRNISIEDAHADILSGMAGNTEALNRYGFAPYVGALEEFTGADYEKMSESEKRKARYDFITGKTEYFAGDYWNTQDELANSTRTLENYLERMRVSIGDRFIPIAEAGINAANGFFESLYSENAEETLASIDATAQSTVASIEGTATNARAMVGVLEDYGDKSALTAEQQAQWNTVAGELIRAIPELSSLIDMQTGTIDGGTEALFENINAWEAAGKAAADTAALEEKRGMLADLSAEIANEQGLLAIAEKQLVQNQDEVIALGAQVAETLGKEFDGTVESTRKLLDSNAGRYAALKTGLSETDIHDMLSPLNEAETAIAEHKENIAALQTEYSTVEQAVERDSVSLSETVGEMEQSVTGAFSDIESATDSLVSNFDQSGAAYTNAYNTGLGAANGLNAAYPAYRQAASQYTFDPPSPGEGGSESELPGHETGLDYVPHDDYIARLHEGEAVLTKEEAGVWRAGGAPVQPIDYNALADAVASALNGSFVDMDREHVGRLVTPTVSKEILRESRHYRYNFNSR